MSTWPTWIRLMPLPEPTLEVVTVAPEYAFAHLVASGKTSEEPASLIVVANALAAPHVAITPSVATPTQMIRLRCTAKFLSKGGLRTPAGQGRGEAGVFGRPRIHEGWRARLATCYGAVIKIWKTCDLRGARRRFARGFSTVRRQCRWSRNRAVDPAEGARARRARLNALRSARQHDAEVARVDRRGARVHRDVPDRLPGDRRRDRGVRQVRLRVPRAQGVDPGRRASSAA